MLARKVLMRDPQDRVLVTDSGTLNGDLPVVRSLFRRKISTTIMVQDFWTPSMFSRHRPTIVYAPDSALNVKGFMTRLIKLVRSGKYITIFPRYDTSLIPISENREKLIPNVELALPSHEALMKTIDKTDTLKLAEKIGIPIPKTFHVKNKYEVEDIAEKIQYPAVIKPKRSWEFGKVKNYFSHPFYANSASNLISTYVEVVKAFPGSMIQEYVPGYNLQIGLLFDHGKPVAACAIREYRTLPTTGGQSVFRESVYLEPTLMDHATKLLSCLDWHGVAEVEFRLDSRDLTPKLMEINGRFWGSMNVAIESGVDFPYLLYLLAKGKDIDPVFKYKTGVKFRLLNQDIKNLQANLKSESELVALQSVNKFNVVLNFLKVYEKNLHYDGFKLSDPLPFFMDTSLTTYFILKEWLKQKMRLKTNSIENKVSFLKGKQ